MPIWIVTSEHKVSISMNIEADTQEEAIHGWALIKEQAEQAYNKELFSSKNAKTPMTVERSGVNITCCKITEAEG